MIQEEVMSWLLDSDPSIKWQVMRDLMDAPEPDVAAVRSRVPVEGYGANLLALQREDGTWAGEAWNPTLDSTMHALWLLQELGVDQNNHAVKKAIQKVKEQVHWRGWDRDGEWHGFDHVGNPYFLGEVEPCINGQVVVGGAYFGQDVEWIMDRLLRDQLADGGWNCEIEYGSTRSSFNTTICVLEALLQYEKNFGKRPEITEARLKGQEYFLERHLMRRKSTGELLQVDRRGKESFTDLAFPPWWHYDVLRGLDYLRKAGVEPDIRVEEAIKLLQSKRRPDGRWSLERLHGGKMLIPWDEVEGQPSRWNTLRALRVLKWYSKYV
ncbi:MAG: hypothetical protein AB9921_01540 [Erysipelotrichaceae bacterium]